MNNSKGFTFIEILAVITLLGIVLSLAVAGYSSYTEYARERSFKVMAQSAKTAAEQYVMDNPGIAHETSKRTVDGKTIYEIPSLDSKAGVSFEDLISENYLSGAEDPANKDVNCTGTVRVGYVEDKYASGKHKEGYLDRYIFVVDECCANHKVRYTYTFDTNDEPVEKTADAKAYCP